MGHVDALAAFGSVGVVGFDVGKLPEREARKVVLREKHRGVVGDERGLILKTPLRSWRGRGGVGPLEEAAAASFGHRKRLSRPMGARPGDLRGPVSKRSGRVPCVAVPCSRHWAAWEV